jgi:hypothetical protein
MTTGQGPAREQERSGARQYQGPLPSRGECSLEPPGTSAKAAKGLLFVLTVPSPGALAWIKEAVSQSQDSPTRLKQPSADWPCIRTKTSVGHSFAASKGRRKRQQEKAVNQGSDARHRREKEEGSYHEKQRFKPGPLGHSKRPAS